MLVVSIANLPPRSSNCSIEPLARCLRKPVEADQPCEEKCGIAFVEKP